VQLVAPRGRVVGGGQPLAPRRAAQPCEVDDLAALGELAGARERRLDRGLVDGVGQHDLRDRRAAGAAGRQRVDGLGMAVRRPDGSAQVGDDERVDDRVEVAQVALADLHDDELAHGRELAGAHVALDGDRGLRVDRRAARFDGADDRARGVVAPHTAQAIGDLAAPLAVDHAHEVQRPRRDALLGHRVALRDELSQRRLDRVRRGALLAPDHVGRAHTIRQRASPISSFCASSGPCEPAG
jgi:hypothetical protein